MATAHGDGLLACGPLLHPNFARIAAALARGILLKHGSLTSSRTPKRIPRGKQELFTAPSPTRKAPGVGGQGRIALGWGFVCVTVS